MENKKEKCSFIDHNQIDACSYCQECKIYMCNKCSIYHKGLLKNHQQYNLGKDFNNIFLNICKEKDHIMKLEYFCKNHNTLCCDSCITKIKGNGKGQHKDCKIYILEEIKNEKKNKLEENIKYLEDLSTNLVNNIKELKSIFEKRNERKEELKLNILKVFTKIRNALNERENELLNEIDKYFNDNFDNEDLIRESGKLPDKIKITLEKGKSINNKWKDYDNNKLVEVIYDCINIENNIKKINSIHENIKKLNYNNINTIEFSSKEFLDDILNRIKSFGKVYKKLVIDSLILTNGDKIIKFCELLSDRIKINNFKLLYRGTRDILNYENVIGKINNKSNLLFLYYTGNKRIFGSFIKTRLENIVHGKYYKDENAFVFSLNNNKIYNILIPDKAIIFYNDINLIGTGNVGNGNGYYFKQKIIYDGGLLIEPIVYNFQKNSELTENLNTFNEFEIFEINSY